MSILANTRTARLAILLVLVVIFVSLEDVVAAASEAVPRIANGLLSQSYPAVGLLLLYLDGQSNGSCSGTMVGCDTFITAGHCVCDNDADTAEQCQVTDPSNMIVYLQHGGRLAVRSVTLNPEYNFGVGGDIGILKLATPLNGIAPLPINRTAQPAFGTSGTLVGFGTTGLSNSAGIKRMGKVVVGACTSDHPNDRNVCWSFREPQGAPGSNSDTCEGDSGGPILVDFGAGNVVAGTTSGGSDFGCLPPDDSFDTDVFFYRDFIASIGGDDLDRTSCGNLPQLGGDGVVEHDETAALNLAERSYSVNVPAGTRLLRVGLNGETGGSRRGNDFDLYLRYAQLPTVDAFDCASKVDPTAEFCEIASPQPGPWNILVRNPREQGTFQLTTTIFAGCVADCDANGSVGMDDLQRTAAVVLGQQASATCGSADANADGLVNIDDLVLAVNASTSCHPPGP